MKTRKKIALKDIAKELGVSTALVSYVLNDKFPDRINQDTAKKIRDLAEKLNYRPNQIAKSLKRNKTFTIGLIIADISNLFYSGIARIIEDEAKKMKYNVIFGSADENQEKFIELIHIFLGRQVDGIILAAPEGSESAIEYLKSQQVPFVLIDRFFPKIHDINTVLTDNYKASFMVGDHLYQQGFRNPAMVTLNSELFHLQERSRGFIDAYKEKGLKAPLIVEIPEEELHLRIEEVLEKSLSENIDALYFSTNKIAIEGLSVLARKKIKIPEDMGVVCFDEADAYKLFSSTISFVKQPLQKIGKKAVQKLLEAGSAAENIILSAELVQGESTNKIK